MVPRALRWHAGRSLATDRLHLVKTSPSCNRCCPCRRSGRCVSFRCHECPRSMFAVDRCVLQPWLLLGGVFVQLVLAALLARGVRLILTQAPSLRADGNRRVHPLLVFV